MKVKIKVHTYARTNKSNPEGKLPVYIRITVDGQRLEFSTTIKTMLVRLLGEKSYYHELDDITLCNFDNWTHQRLQLQPLYVLPVHLEQRRRLSPNELNL